jgi:hypothetical protein
MTTESYRKLPGRRRGLIRGASLWLGSGYLLSVKSARFREDYKRFYFRDVQAIAVARAPRFHISTRAMLIGALWLTAFGISSAAAPQYRPALWGVAAALVIAWSVISAFFSCRCRIYTAVSREELPSIYRLWTARKLLNRLTPHIAQVQGAVDPNWAELSQEIEPAQASPLAGAAVNPLRSDGPLHTLAADILIATLWVSGLADLLLLRSSAGLATQEQLVSALALIVESVILFIQYHRGMLRAPMRNLAIATMFSVGAMYYVKQMMFSFSQGMQQGAAKTAVKIPFFFSGSTVTRGIDAAICIILGLVGLGIIFLNKDRRSPSDLNL